MMSKANSMGANEIVAQWMIKSCARRRAGIIQPPAIELRADHAVRLSDERGQADEQRNRDAQYETYRNQSNRNDQIDTSYRQSSDRVFRKK
jgi:hypothetical protein